MWNLVHSGVPYPLFTTPPLFASTLCCRLRFSFSWLVRYGDNRSIMVLIYMSPMAHSGSGDRSLWYGRGARFEGIGLCGHHQLARGTQQQGAVGLSGGPCALWCCRHTSRGEKTMDGLVSSPMLSLIHEQTQCLRQCGGT